MLLRVWLQAVSHDSGLKANLRHQANLTMLGIISVPADFDPVSVLTSSK